MATAVGALLAASGGPPHIFDWSHSMLALDTLTVVRLVSDRYQDLGVARGAIGPILDVYDDTYEVEFSRDDGTTIGWFPVGPDDVEPVACDRAARSAGPAG
jgi:Domain of unknown function (DUF4926)